MCIRTVILLALASLAGCVLRAGPPPTATLIPSPTVPPAPTAAPESDGWLTLAPGLEQRLYRPDGNVLGQLYVVRIDPVRYQFRAHYRPGAPLTLNGWRSELPDAVGFVNANFFTPEHTLLGMLVADGVVYGQSFQNRGGTFLVQNGQARLRSNLWEPYAGESYEQAVQAFPMLVLNGQTAYESSIGQEQVSRRTVVALDQQGRVLLMVTPLIGLTLETLSNYLPTTDMGIVDALNLDGGGSTLLYVYAPGGSPPQSLPSFDPVPAVLAVYPRN